MGVNSLPKTVTQQRRGCDLYPGPSEPESSTLTTRLPSHAAGSRSTNFRCYWWGKVGWEEKMDGMRSYGSDRSLCNENMVYSHCQAGTVYFPRTVYRYF